MWIIWILLGFFCLFWSLSGVILSAERSERAERIKTLLFYAQRAVILTWNAILQCACCLADFLKRNWIFLDAKNVSCPQISLKIIINFSEIYDKNDFLNVFCWISDPSDLTAPLPIAQKFLQNHALLNFRKFLRFFSTF